MKTNFTSYFPRAAMALLVMLLTSLSAWADVTIDGIQYVLDDEKATAEVSGVINKTLTTVTIPTTVESDSKTYTVTAIGNAAFYACENLTTVSFADGSQLTTIGSDAFANCTNLASITIPDGVTSIGNGAFFETSLTDINIPASVTSIGDRTFKDCANLADVGFASGSKLTTIGDYAFSGTSLTTLDIPASVTSIGESAFSECGPSVLSLI